MQWQGWEYQVGERTASKQENTHTHKDAQSKSKFGAGKMAQQVNMLVTKPDDLGLMPGSHTKEEEN